MEKHHDTQRTAMGQCGILPIAEDNARFLLLALVLVIYMVIGATVFQYLESDLEIRQAHAFWDQYLQFCSHYIEIHNRDDVVDMLSVASSSSTLSATDNVDEQLIKNKRLHSLLYAYGNATATGIIHKRRRWDFAGSFHFVGTIVSTIGYGNTAPQTTMGKAVVIVYGFLGCSGGILFFNLFLERIITFLAWILRTIHLRRVKKHDDDVGLEHWKPSVYWVMLSLTIASCVVATCAAAVYSPFEKWSYFEAIYFCFVSFATIGFGDYVSTDDISYPNLYIYRVVNFMFLVIGCCCIYSLLNVTSIVIKQFLNWMIIRLQCRCFNDPTSAAGRIWRRHSFQHSRRRRRRRSSAALPSAIKRSRRAKIIAALKHANENQEKTSPQNDSDSCGGYDSEEAERNRKMSGELISMKDFLQANKVSLAVMQKQLYETAQMQRGGDIYQQYNGPSRRYPEAEFRPGLVGPLAIVSEKLGDKNTR
ncbi:potassium channel subfamily K member 13-like [Chrysoperla carnea]|uniref:potassium channel subfamily K member 13-like n=1 Tax=Chrysoperla carnea TaxID=189513 RepID=UPI001D0647DB|nr:potassium channel subfamily K member 13-like [Chrysoperla carnea]